MVASRLSSSRQNLLGVALGGSIFLIGGLGRTFSDRAVIRDVSIYDPNTDVWVAGTPIPRGREHAGGAVVGNRLYVTGGFTGSGDASSRVFIYNALEESWSSGRRMPTARGAHTVVGLGGLVYAIGGGNLALGKTNLNEAFDPVAGEWASLAPMPTARDRLAATAHEGLIYTFGGRNGDDIALNVVEVYDPATNRWHSAGPMPVPLSGLAAVSLGSRIYLFGGSPVGFPSAVEVRPEVWRYNSGRDEWDILPSPMPTPRQAMAAIGFEDRIYVIGGGVGEGFEPSDVNEVFVP